MKAFKKNAKRSRRNRNPGRGGLVGYQSSGARWSYSSRNMSQRQSAVQPFPLQYKARLTYGVNVTMTTVGNVNTATLNRFALNGLYDPDLTGLGHQPYQYDQLTAIYLNYIVTDCWIDLTFTDPTIDGLWVGWVCRTGSVSNDSPSSLTLSDFMERPNFQCFPLNNTGAQTVTAKLRVPVHEVLGLPKVSYMGNIGVYGAQYNFNPTGIAYLDVFVVDPTANVTGHSVRCSGRLVYDAVFMNYASPAAS